MVWNRFTFISLKFILVIGLTLLVFLSRAAKCHEEEDVDDGEDHEAAFDVTSDSSFQFGQTNGNNHTKYLIYGVNPGEGFNLRRDVYTRVANLIQMVRQEKGADWVLVLPPWRRLYHWRSQFEQNALPWKTFFDINNLNKYIPVIEFEEFVRLTGSPSIDQIYYLQRHKDGYKSGFVEKKEIEECHDPPAYRKQDGKYRGYFWGLDYVYGKAFDCLSVQGTSAVLSDVLLSSKVRSIMIDRAESVLHQHYGQTEFWRARRSLVLAKHIRRAGDEFRLKVLNSTDEADNTIYNEDDWHKQAPVDGSARGGPYLGIHFRRFDYLRAHPKLVPSLKNAALQINKILEDEKLSVVFIATDTNKEEIDELKTLVNGTIYQYKPPLDVIKKIGDAGVAVTDQWIVAHAQYFIGTCLSTFSFRIHEERDILGFDERRTYNCLCGDEELEKCEQPTKWRVKFD